MQPLTPRKVAEGENKKAGLRKAIGEAAPPSIIGAMVLLRRIIPAEVLTFYLRSRSAGIEREMSGASAAYFTARSFPMLNFHVSLIFNVAVASSSTQIAEPPATTSFPECGRKKPVSGPRRFQHVHAVPRSIPDKQNTSRPKHS